MEDLPLYFCNECPKSFNHTIILAFHKKYQHRTKDSSSDCKTDVIPANMTSPKFSKCDNNEEIELQLKNSVQQESAIERPIKSQSVGCGDGEADSSLENIHPPFQTLRRCTNTDAKAKFNSEFNSMAQSQAKNTQQKHLNSHSHGYDSSSIVIGTEEEGKLNSKSIKPKKKFLKNATSKDLTNQDHLTIIDSERKSLGNKSFDCREKQNDQQKQIQTRSNSQAKKRILAQDTAADDEDGPLKKLRSSANWASLVSTETSDGANPNQLPSSSLVSKRQIDSSTKRRSTTSKRKENEGVLVKVKSHKCSYCDYSSARADNLKTHVRIHTGEKPFKCRYCDHCTTDGSGMKRHERIHTGERPYKCRYCDHSTNEARSIRMHERIHAGPYKCGSCDFTARTQSSLTSHLRTHTE